MNFTTTWRPQNNGGVELIVATVEDGVIFTMRLDRDAAEENLRLFAAALGEAVPDA